MQFFSESKSNKKRKDKFKVFNLKDQGKVLEVSKNQTGKSIKEKDLVRDALPPGKRVSKTGKIYYEYRKNRSDKRGKQI